ncbi:hypothetical protein BISA_1887 [Bifidobacterium saguini DSM 23967]|uniref:Uncharacterized protein n=1 Tax=Bifidobacterium saguini DSM 23967 TaxID=1437607 RepID=A0A087D6Y4_9BIFI|nr:hypothetical protein BISA_1887 [Bifidobacterium saguini DSM 23967]
MNGHGLLPYRIPGPQQYGCDGTRVTWFVETRTLFSEPAPLPPSLSPVLGMEKGMPSLTASPAYRF